MARPDREDLGALFTRISRRLIDAERPLLDRHGLTMWGYIALSRVAAAPASTQLALARDIGYDKTRLITLLDALEHDGLIERGPDPADRRAHVVRITVKGARRHAAAVADIRAMEEDLLGVLEATERRALLAALPKLAAAGGA
ncbi:MAG TPA: MarR family winged helix-turn-helix transcriptional regulator [Baekduia sp.]|nr:MarR family winged helix-turn-helix transcriptional regulator [Baekduia sp.]